MKTLNYLVIAVAAAAVAGPAFAGRDGVDTMLQEKAVKNLRAAQAAEQQKKGLAGAVGAQGKVGPTTQGGPLPIRTGHPTERR